eukprot:XP_001701296.1 predicted protein [Chlamydomonas reinhardtii]
MQVSRAAVCARSSFVRVQAFSSCPVVRVSTCARVRVNSACRSAAQPRQRPSRFVGARSELSDSLKETAALDELIDKLLSAKSQQQLAQLVAENVVAVDTKFWMRIATRNDTAASKEDKDKLQQQLADSGAVLQDILVAAADDKGEWYLPLTDDQVESVREALNRHRDRLDEALLSNAFAWIKKSSEDGFDGMVQLLQLVLQLYAARQLATGETEGVEGAVNKLLGSQEKQWTPLLRQLVAEGQLTEAAFMEALQRKMEGVVLGLQSGSYAQRVQAEYLKEAEARAKSVFQEIAASAPKQA